jgi:PHD/YefM family antitoxin component YafN of YafNO toxin-antitoxin module
VSDVLDLDGTGNQLQIQRDTAARKTGSHDLSKNKERSTFVWAAFHERARRGHGKMRLLSWLVKQILDEHGLDTNPNTVRRVMEFVARGTSQRKTPDPENDDNLVTLKHRNEKNILVADEDEWESFFAEQTEHINSVDEDTDTNNQRSDDSSDDQADADTVRENADEEFDVLSSAAPITSNEDESVGEEITVS